MTLSIPLVGTQDFFSCLLFVAFLQGHLYWRMLIRPTPRNPDDLGYRFQLLTFVVATFAPQGSDEDTICATLLVRAPRVSCPGVSGCTELSNLCLLSGICVLIAQLVAYRA